MYSIKQPAYALYRYVIFIASLVWSDIICRQCLSANASEKIGLRFSSTEEQFLGQ